MYVRAGTPTHGEGGWAREHGRLRERQCFPQRGTVDTSGERVTTLRRIIAVTWEEITPGNDCLAQHTHLYTHTDTYLHTYTHTVMHLDTHTSTRITQI